MSFSLLALHLAGVAALLVAPPDTIATHLRGSEVLGPAPAPALGDRGERVGPAPAPALGDRGERGHFYYSDGCEDCFYKGIHCGCQPSLEYFACLTKHCFSSNRTRFAEKCTEHGDECSNDLDIDCRGPATSCKSKFHQLPQGGLGLSLDLDGAEDDAFCGPHGKCIGKIHMKVNIHNAPQRPSSAPAPSFASSPVPAALVAPAPTPGALTPGAPAPSAGKPIWLECGLPNVSNASIDSKDHWIICQAEAKGDKAACDIPMFPTLKASEGKEAYCLLTAGKGGERLTNPAYHKIVNVHDAPQQQSESTFGSIFDHGLKLPWMED